MYPAHGGSRCSKNCIFLRGSKRLPLIRLPVHRTREVPEIHFSSATEALVKSSGKSMKSCSRDEYVVASVSIVFSVSLLQCNIYLGSPQHRKFSGVTLRKEHLYLFGVDLSTTNLLNTAKQPSKCLSDGSHGNHHRGSWHRRPGRRDWPAQGRPQSDGWHPNPHSPTARHAL